MKVFAVPTTVSGVTAGLSFLFYVGISRQFGDPTLGQIVMMQAVAAIILMMCLPQCWVYIIGAQRSDDLQIRYRHAATIEIFGIALGALTFAMILAFPVHAFSGWRGAAFLLYSSLAIQGMTSCLGWLRATESWSRYALWNLAPNLIRVPLIWGMPWLNQYDLLIVPLGDNTRLIFIYFFVPDLVRLVTIALPILLQNYIWPGIAETIKAVRTVKRNWLFDLGSTMNETADRLVVGVLLGPNVLVAYFFARRLGSVVSMVTEPYFAENYRRLTRSNSSEWRNRSIYRVYGAGILFALVIALVMVAAIFMVSSIPFFIDLIPPAILSMFAIFSGVLLIDSLIAANRWSRFITQMDGGARQLLLVRSTLFGMFCGGLFLLGNIFNAWGVVLALATSGLLECVYLLYRMHHFTPPLHVQIKV